MSIRLEEYIATRSSQTISHDGFVCLCMPKVICRLSKLSGYAGNCSIEEKRNLTITNKEVRRARKAKRVFDIYSSDLFRRSHMHHIAKAPLITPTPSLPLQYSIPAPNKRPHHPTSSKRHLHLRRHLPNRLPPLLRPPRPFYFQGPPSAPTTH